MSADFDQQKSRFEWSVRNAELIEFFMEYAREPMPMNHGAFEVTNCGRPEDRAAGDRGKGSWKGPRAVGVGRRVGRHRGTCEGGTEANS